MDNTLITSPAKINPVLRVLGRRLDGYHELETLMVPIGLFDQVRLERRAEGIQVRSFGTLELNGPANIAHRAARAWFSRLDQAGHSGTGLGGISITIEKSIPAAAGLGGGSSNAAATLRGLQELYDFPLNNSVLHEIARNLGADVPFFLKDGPCWATGIGERLVRVRSLPPFSLVLACAPFGLSTREIYGNLNFTLTSIREDDSENRPGWDFGTLVEELVNDLQSTSEKMRPEIRQECDKLLAVGAAGALMSGSGPSVFGIFEHPEQAEQAREELLQTSRKPGWTYLMLRASTSD